MHAGQQGTLVHWYRDRSTETAGDLADTLAYRPVWWAGALCRGSGTELWFPPRGDSAMVVQLRAVCRACPVRADCLRQIMDWPGSTHLGVWAGTVDRDRRRLRAQGELTTKVEQIRYDRATGDVEFVPIAQPLAEPDARRLLDELVAGRPAVAAATG